MEIKDNKKVEQEAFLKDHNSHNTTLSIGVKNPPAPTSNLPEIISNETLINFRNSIVFVAPEISKALKKIIDDTKAYIMINGKKHVRVEGWETLGAMLRCTSEITLVKEYKNGYWSEAVIKDQSGHQISKGTGICLRDESIWKTKDEYAILSMAQTRAVGKAYRLAFSWIISMAGYEPCPAEEMIKETKIQR